jgi:alpha-methylacyl-CoA racemase
VAQPAPAPRFSRSAPDIGGPPTFAGQHTDEALQDWGFDAAEISKLREAGAVR